MPQAKPSKVIVHRIELQQSERQMLKEYVEERQKQQWVKTAGLAVQPVLLAGGAIAATYVGIRGYQALQAALNALDVPGALDELMKPVYPAITRTPVLGPLFGKGGLFDFVYDAIQGDSAEDNPLYDDTDFTEEELEQGAKELREEVGVLNSITAPFGFTPFPKWL
jgi:hypothetical protein